MAADTKLDDKKDEYGFPKGAQIAMGIFQPAPDSFGGVVFGPPPQTGWEDKVSDNIGGVRTITEPAGGVMDEGKERASRFNKGKLEWSNVDFKALEPMVKALMFGAKEYGKYNYRKGLIRDEILDSLMRHVFALLDGEENDPKSGESHIGHIQANAMFLGRHVKQGS